MLKNEENNGKRVTVAATFRFAIEFHKQLKIHLATHYPPGYSLNKLVVKLLEKDMEECTKKSINQK